MRSQFSARSFGFCLRRTRTKCPCSRSPCRVNFSSPFSRSAAGEADTGAQVPRSPGLHRACAIVALRDFALELGILDRMVLDVNRQALVLRVHGGSLRHRPTPQNAAVLEPEIIVQPGRVVFLDHEDERLAGFGARHRPRLRRTRKIPARPVVADAAVARCRCLCTAGFRTILFRRWHLRATWLAQCWFQPRGGTLWPASS